MGKSKLVTIKLSKETLKGFPTNFSTPVKESKKNPRSRKQQLASSPTPKSPDSEKTPALASSATGTPAATNNTKTNISKPGVVTSSVSASTGAATINSSGSLDSTNKKLDKSGTAVRKWSKKPFAIQSFTGYSITFSSWTGDAKPNEINATKHDEEKLNNKNLNINNNNNDAELSNAPSPFPDEASSTVTTPTISRVSTPISR